MPSLNIHILVSCYHFGTLKIHNLHISLWNIVTMRDRASDVIETIDLQLIDLCCTQELHWKNCSARLISAKGFKYKFVWSGGKSSYGGVGILFIENWIDKLFFVVQPNH